MIAHTKYVLERDCSGGENVIFKPGQLQTPQPTQASIFSKKVAP